MARTPAVEEILAKYEAAVGDPTVARAHSTRVIRSKSEDLYGDEADLYEVFLAPDKYLQMTVYGEGVVLRLATDGKFMWRDAPRSLEVVEAEKVPPFARDAVFNRHLKLREIYPQMRVVGEAMVAGKRTWQIEAIAPDGDKEELYFDVDTGLLVRRKYERMVPSGERYPWDAIYEEYEDFGGVRLPSLTRVFAPNAMVLRVEHVDHNADVYEIVFKPPQRGGEK